MNVLISWSKHSMLYPFTVRYVGTVLPLAAAAVGYSVHSMHSGVKNGRFQTLTLQGLGFPPCTLLASKTALSKPGFTTGISHCRLTWLGLDLGSRVTRNSCLGIPIWLASLTSKRSPRKRWVRDSCPDSQVSMTCGLTTLRIEIHKVIACNRRREIILWASLPEVHVRLVLFSAVF